MSFTRVQAGTTATGTGTVTCPLSASGAGSLLVANVFTPAGGVPFTAPAGWKLAGRSGGGTPILFGCNEARFAAISAEVTGLSTAITYVPASAGTGGVPASWPGHGTFPAGVTTQIVNFLPDVTQVLSGALDAALTAWFSSAPNGSWIMAYHEANLAQDDITADQCQALDNYLLALKNTVNPTLMYGRGLSTSAPVKAPSYVTPGMDFYGMDGYQHSNASVTPDSIFGPILADIRAVQPDAQVAIIETGTALNVTTWLNELYDFATANDLFCVQTYWAAGGTGSQPWSSGFAPAMQTLSNELAATGATEDVEIWYYPGNPGGITSAVFSNAGGLNCRGSVTEFSTAGGTVQVLDGSPGAAGGPGPATSFPVATADVSAAGDLGIVAFGNDFSSATAGTWTAPGGWTQNRQVVSVANAWVSYYQAPLLAGTQSVTGTFSTSVNQTGWAGVLAVFREVAVLAVTTTSLPGGEPGRAYSATLAATVGPDSWALGTGTLPAGLALDPVAGVISGTPVAPGTGTFTMIVTDSAGLTASSGTLTLTVAGPVFPAAPAGLACELNLAGTWTDITPDTVQDGTPAPVAVTISRGRPDQTTTQASPQTGAFRLNNRSGNYTPRNPVGAYYGLLNRNTPVRWSIPSAAPYLRLEEDNSSSVSCPGTTALNITGSIDIRIDLALSSYMPGVLAVRNGAWILALNGDGTIQFTWTDSSNAGHNRTSTQPLPNLGRIMIRVTLDVTTRNVTFWTAATMSSSQTQLGEIILGTSATSIKSLTAHVSVGDYSPSVSQSLDGGITGSIYEFRLYNGIGGTLVADPLFTAQTAGATSFTDGQGNVWSLAGTAELSDRDYRFHGELAALPQSWDPSGHDIWTPVTAAGVLRRLGSGGGGAGTAGGAPVQSPLKRAILAQAGDLAPVAYWPAEDTTGATVFGSATGGPAMSFTGTPTLASDSSFTCSAPIPVLNGSEFDGQVPAYTGSGSIICRFLLNIPTSTSTPDGAIICRVLGTRTVREFTLRYKTGGALELAGFDHAGINLFDTGPVAFAVEGKLLWVSMELRPSGSNINWSVVTLQPGASTGLGTSGSTGGNIGNCTGIQVNPNNTIIDAAAGHFQVQSAWQSLFALYQPLDAWVAEPAARRFARLCSENGITARVQGFPDTSVLLGAQPVDTLQNVLQQCEDADRGQIYEPRQVNGVAYRTLASMTGQAPQVLLDYDQDHLSPPLTPTDDDLYTVNDVTAAGTGGSSSQVTLNDGSAMSVRPPPAGVGDYSASVSVNPAEDSQLADIAGWILHLGTTDTERYPSIVIDMADTSAAMTAIGPAVGAADIGAYLQIIHPPAWVPPGPVKQLVWGTAEILGDFTRLLTWNCVPETPYEVGLFDDPVYGRADTDGSQLDTAIGTTDTSMLVDITGPSGIGWTTDPADWPFDVMISGEQVTVTATGAADWLTGDDATFDASAGDWTAIANCTIAQTTAKAHSGAGSLAVTATSSSTTSACSCTAASIISNGLPVSPGDLIEVGVWMLAATTGRIFGVGADFYDATGVFIETDFVPNTGPATDNTSTWTQFTGTVAAPAAAAYARLNTGFIGAGTGEVHYVDDAFLTDLSAAPQQFTIIRSINGVVKAHNAGEDIRLAFPAILAMT